ncbi:MAG: hypothetical protein LIO97_10315 [Tannerellaceae bacterium]|nr:hypothetical protein [Tannerellaceae bacterium]
MENTITFRESSTEVLKDRFIGMVHTDWGSAEGFMKEYELVKKGKPTRPDTAANAFYHLFSKMKEVEAK